MMHAEEQNNKIKIKIIQRMTIKKMRKNNHIINIIHNNNTQWRDERFLIK